MILILDLCLYTGSLGRYLVDLFKNLALDNPKGYMFTSGQQRKECQFNSSIFAAVPQYCRPVEYFCVPRMVTRKFLHYLTYM